MTTTKTTLLAGITALTTEQLHQAIEAIGGGHVETDQRMVRAYLIEEIITREGVAVGDELMDRMGL